MGTEDTLSDAFRAVSHRMRQTSLESLARWDVTPSQSRALMTLARAGDDVRLSELSAFLRIAPRSTTEVVDDLESKSLLVRRPDPGDRRATLVSLTEKGLAVLHEIRDARGAEAERMFDRLTATDRKDLTRILKKLRD